MLSGVHGDPEESQEAGDWLVRACSECCPYTIRAAEHLGRGEGRARVGGANQVRSQDEEGPTVAESTLTASGPYCRADFFGLSSPSLAETLGDSMFLVWSHTSGGVGQKHRLEAFFLTCQHSIWECDLCPHAISNNLRFSLFDSRWSYTFIDLFFHKAPFFLLSANSNISKPIYRYHQLTLLHRHPRVPQSPP